MKKPLVSVLINNYNYAEYLSECIESVLNQTYKNVEIIVLDDCSTDGSRQVIDEYCNKIKTIFIKEREKSPYKNFNQMYGFGRMFQEANGDIICFLDSDDYFELDKVEKVVDKFLEDENIVLVQNYARAIDDYKNDLGVMDYNSLDTMDYVTEFYSKNKCNFFMPTSSISFRYEFLKKKLPMLDNDDYWRVWMDARLTMMAAFYGHIGVVKEPLTYYRLHNENDSFIYNNSKYDSLKRFINQHKYINSFCKQHGYPEVKYYLNTEFFKLLILSVTPRPILKLLIKIVNKMGKANPKDKV